MSVSALRGEQRDTGTGAQRGAGMSMKMSDVLHAKSIFLLTAKPICQ